MKKLLILGILAVLVASVVIPFAAMATGDSMQILPVAVILTASAFLNPPVSHLLGTSLDISELETKLGEYYRENRNVLIREKLFDDDIKTTYNVMDDVTDEVPLPSLTIGAVVKPATLGGFTPKADAVAFDARTLKVRPWQVDIEIIPEQVYKSWLGMLKSNKDIYQMPFEEYILADLISKAKEELLLQTIYNGVHNASGTNALAVADGYKKHIADALTASEITAIVTGALTAENIIDKVELVADGLGEAYTKMATEIHVSDLNFKRYVRKYRGLFGGNTDYIGMNRDRVAIDGSNAILVRKPEMGVSNRIIHTAKDNFYMGINSSEFVLNVEKHKRKLFIMLDGKIGTQFAEMRNKAIAVNDQV